MENNRTVVLETIRATAMERQSLDEDCRLSKISWGRVKGSLWEIDRLLAEKKVIDIAENNQKSSVQTSKG